MDWKVRQRQLHRAVPSTAWHYSNLATYGQRLTHLPAPHPLTIKHPLNLGRRCRLVWKPKKINRGPFPLNSDLFLHKQTRYLQSTDISEIPLATPWPLKSISLLVIFEVTYLTELKPIHIPVFYFSYPPYFSWPRPPLRIDAGIPASALTASSPLNRAHRDQVNTIWIVQNSKN